MVGNRMVEGKVLTPISTSTLKTPNWSCLSFNLWIWQFFGPETGTGYALFQEPWKGTCAVDVVHVDAGAGWRHQTLILEAF